MTNSALRLAGARLLGTLAVFAALALTACDRSAPAPTPDTPPNETYVVRGEVVQIPEPGKPAHEFQVHHEAIDNFVGITGKVVGMSAMTMPFPLGPGVTLDGIAVGDKVEIEFKVWRDGGNLRYHASRLTELPADTVLEFRAHRAPGN